MGTTISRLMRRPCRRVCILGLRGAGKSTWLHKIARGEYALYTPTVGFRIECVLSAQVEWLCWDVGASDGFHQLHHHFLVDATDIVFVVDASDRGLLESAAVELERVLRNTALSARASLLVCANKNDLPSASSADEVRTAMGLDAMPTLSGASSRPWRVISCGDGANSQQEGPMYEALDWLSSSSAPKRMIHPAAGFRSNFVTVEAAAPRVVTGTR